jgi:hypothetical protein
VSRSAWGAALLVAVAFAALTGCTSSGRDAGEPEPEPAPSVSRLVTDLEEFAGVDVPADARNVEVKFSTNNIGQPVYRATFKVSEDGARAFCSGNAFGGPSTRPNGLSQPSRERFGVVGSSVTTPFGCDASKPADYQVQRNVLVTVPTAGEAVVHLIAFRMPSR